MLYDREYWASDYHIEYFDAYLEWNVTEVNAENLTLLIRFEILLNNLKIFSNETNIKVDIHGQIIINNDLRGEPLMLWTLARQAGDIISLPNHTSGTINEESKSFITDAGAFDILLAKASYDICTEEEKIHLECGYGFEKDSGLLVSLAGGTVDPIFRAVGVRYLVGVFELKESNVPVNKIQLLTLFDVIFIVISRILIIVAVILTIIIIVRMIVKHKR